jgi:hypothetical protein
MRMRYSRTNKKLRKADRTVSPAVFLSAILLAALLAGCGPFYGLFIAPLIPKKKVMAEHEMQGKNVLVWVEISATTEHSPILRRELTLKLKEELILNEAVGQIIDYNRLVQFRHRNPRLAELSIKELGDKFQANEVLYILINKYKLKHEAGEGYYHASSGGYVKVIDVATGRRLWPAGQNHRFFHVDGGVTIGAGQQFENEQVRQLCESIAKKISPFFYEHKK